MHSNPNPLDLTWQKAKGSAAPPPTEDNLRDLDILYEAASEIGDVEILRNVELRMNGIVSKVIAKWDPAKDPEFTGAPE